MRKSRQINIQSGIYVEGAKIKKSTLTATSASPSIEYVYFNVDDRNGLENMANAIIGECKILEHSERAKISNQIFYIIEECDKANGRVNPEAISPFKKVFDSLTAVSKKAIIAIAAKLATETVMHILGLK